MDHGRKGEQQHRDEFGGVAAVMRVNKVNTAQEEMTQTTKLANFRKRSKNRHVRSNAKIPLLKLCNNALHAVVMLLELSGECKNGTRQLTKKYRI